MGRRQAAAGDEGIRIGWDARQGRRALLVIAVGAASFLIALRIGASAWALRTDPPEQSLWLTGLVVGLFWLFYAGRLGWAMHKQVRNEALRIRGDTLESISYSGTVDARWKADEIADIRVVRRWYGSVIEIDKRPPPGPVTGPIAFSLTARAHAPVNRRWLWGYLRDPDFDAKVDQLRAWHRAAMAAAPTGTTTNASTEQ